MKSKQVALSLANPGIYFVTLKSIGICYKTYSIFINRLRSVHSHDKKLEIDELSKTKILHCQ